MDILCALRDVQRAMTVYETDFLAAYGLTLNEGMLLCCLSTKRLKASELAETIDLTCSNCSKVIKSLGIEDKRQMFFTLTSQGEEQLKLIQEHPISIPKVLEHVIAHYSK